MLDVKYMNTHYKNNLSYELINFSNGKKWRWGKAL